MCFFSYTNFQYDSRSALIGVATTMALSLPFPLITTVRPMPPFGDMPGLHMLFYNMFMLASVVNPLIYFFTNNFYKKAFNEVFGFSQPLTSPTSILSRSGQISRNPSANDLKTKSLPFPSNPEVFGLSQPLKTSTSIVTRSGQISRNPSSNDLKNKSLTFQSNPETTLI